MTILDANVILRYLLNDIPEMAAEAKEMIINGASATTEVLAEVVYVLSGVYHADRITIADVLGSFIQEIDVQNKAVLQYAFRLYGTASLDFVDCILAGYHHVTGSDIMTFDKKLQKFLQSDLRPE